MSRTIKDTKGNKAWDRPDSRYYKEGEAKPARKRWGRINRHRSRALLHADRPDDVVDLRRTSGWWTN